MRRFILYRPNPPENYIKDAYAVNLDLPQLEGVIFSDGTVAIRWMTSTASTSIWDSLKDFEAIHGHPEYGTKWIWIDDA